MEPNQTQSSGALIGSIVIIVILIIGGIYLWKTSVREQNTMPAENSTAEMEANLDSVELESLDAEI